MKNAVKRFIQMFKNDERGLTLVELLAVVVILAIVGLIAFVSIGNVIENSKQDAHVANAQQIISAAELYEASGGSLVPGEGETLIDIIDTIDKNMLDPWTKESGNYLNDFELTHADEQFKISSEHGKCTFGSDVPVTKAELAQKGRAICKETETP